VQKRESKGEYHAPQPPRLRPLSGAALAQKDVVDGLAVMGLEAISSTPQELAKNLKESYDRWGPIVKKIGFTADS
jgi:tripartite-type tricarboxylate transporter receptor subunit TctC